MTQQKRALVAMSGGVDSAVTAHLVCALGYTALGVTMRLQREDNACCSLSDIEDAARIASSLGMAHEVCDLSPLFEEKVILPFIEAYEHGRTPNPCVACNRHLKFEALYRYGRARGYDTIATGHYARIRYDEASGRYLLLRAADGQKDQSYVLYNMTQEQLAHTLFPLGEMTKGEVRQRAAALGFPNAEKRDSQDICFVPDGDYAAFIEARTGKTYPPGNFVTLDGRVLGRHRGLIRYTLGQRKGLGLALPAPLYVCALDLAENRVLLGEEQALYTKTLLAHDLNLITAARWEQPQRLSARVRYRQKERPATVTLIDDDTLQVAFDEPQRAITRGQAVVLYDGDVVAGGGVIA
jgi:tRNA-specific 2-thiouridylase